MHLEKNPSLSKQLIFLNKVFCRGYFNQPSRDYAIRLSCV